MSSDSIHDAVECTEKRGRTPARSIVAALLARLYTRNCDYLIIKAVSFKALHLSQGSESDCGSRKADRRRGDSAADPPASYRFLRLTQPPLQLFSSCIVASFATSG